MLSSIYSVAFANMPLKFVVACDDDGRISTFRFMPTGQPPSPTDYGKPGHVDAQGIRDIAAWVEAQPAHS